MNAVDKAFEILEAPCEEQELAPYHALVDMDYELAADERELSKAIEYFGDSDFEMVLQVISALKRRVTRNRQTSCAI